MNPEKITSMLELARARFDHAVFRKNLKERVEAQLTVAHNGGLFKATPELISFLTSWDEDVVYAEDVYFNPIKCDRTVLLAQLKQSYQYAMNAWHIEFEESKKIRRTIDV